MASLRFRARSLKKSGFSRNQRRVSIVLAPIQNRIKESDLRDISSKLLSDIPEGRASGIRYLARGYPLLAKPVLEAFLRDPTILVRTQAKVMLAHIEPREGHELYGRALKYASFGDEKRRIVRVFQDKPEGNTVLLGGKLRGKAVIKFMHPENVKAWKRALDSGLPMEPLLRNKDGTIRHRIRKDGRVAVSVGVLKGPSVEAFFQDSGNMKRYLRIVEGQISWIKRSLIRIGVIHNHPNRRNFVVVWEKRRNHPYPKVYLIDFDKAETV
jgi:hypothetical protein